MLKACVLKAASGEGGAPCMAEVADTVGKVISAGINEVRFSHESIAPMFNKEKRTVLGNAIGLLTGKILPETIPMIRVCQYENNLYCASGNRRLASFRLAAMFSPDRFQTICVRVSSMNSRRMRKDFFTTWRNDVAGERCEGRWVRIRGSDKVVGQSIGDKTLGAETIKAALDQLAIDPNKHKASNDTQPDFTMVAQPIYEKLQALCGLWRDRSGSTYELRSGSNGLDVHTTRPTGQVKSTRNTIRVERYTGAIVWGGRPSFVLGCNNIQDGCTELTWESLLKSKGKKEFSWTR